MWKPQRKAWVLLSFVACLAIAQASAQGAPATTPPTAAEPALLVPSELSPYGNGWVAKGSGPLRFFGFKVYDATLWVSNAQLSFSFSRPFALDIRYATSVKAKDISNTSLIELQRVTSSSPEQITAWSALMESIFVDVKAGDQLIGVHLPTISSAL